LGAAGDVDAGEVLARAAADDARHAIGGGRDAGALDAEEAIAAPPLEHGRVAFEGPARTVEGRPDLRVADVAGHPVHGRAAPRRGLLGMARLAGRRTGVVVARHVAGYQAR